MQNKKRYYASSLNELVKIYKDLETQIKTAVRNGEYQTQSQLLSVQSAVEENIRITLQKVQGWADTELARAYALGVSNVTDDDNQIDVITGTFSLKERQESFISRHKIALAATAGILFTSINKKRRELTRASVLDTGRINPLAIKKKLIVDVALDEIKTVANWNLKAYAKNSATDELLNTRNAGVADASVATGSDLVMITGGSSKHDVCNKWNDKVVSLTGETKGYPTYDEAVTEGIFHPNCLHYVVPFDNA